MYCSEPQPTFNEKPKIQKDSPDNYWQDYIKGLQSRKAKNEVQEYVVPRLPSFHWENDSLLKDMPLFWMACYRLHKNRPTIFKDTIDWATQNRLHPMQFVKAVNTRLKR